MTVRVEPISQKLILGSSSSTRKRLLTAAGMSFEARPSPIDERAIEDAFLEAGGAIEDVALLLAGEKARAISLLEPDAWVVGADLTVVLDGELIHKATNLLEAADILNRLQGKTHLLISGCAIYHQGHPVWQRRDDVYLKMRSISRDEIKRYLESQGEKILSAAGCYYYDGVGIHLFESFEGSFFCILGLPLAPLLLFLRDVGFHAY